MKNHKETIHNKLIRDKIPELLKQNKIDCIVKTLNQLDYELALSEKLQEEIFEFQNATSKDHQLEELSDILEVIYAILLTKGTTFAELENIRTKKLAKNGAFAKKIFLEKTLQDNPESLHNSSPCLFCQISKQEKSADIIAQFTHCFVIKDQFPVSKGHLLIIPYEHNENWFTAKKEVQDDMINALNLMKQELDSMYKPDGYNFGVNCGEYAGQTVMHLHMHLIPRYKGDMVNPRGGIRGLIPAKQKYSTE